jgi:hypothetical protein
MKEARKSVLIVHGLKILFAALIAVHFSGYKYGTLIQKNMIVLGFIKGGEA